MNSVYRVELAKSSRAICQATHHKNNKIKVAKGELRLGVWVAFEDSGSYKWRHWGCVVPETLHNWHMQVEDDMDMVDGYEDLPELAREKVERCLLQEHVDDDEFEGDVELNRFVGKTRTGLFLPGSEKKQRWEATLPEASDTEKDMPKPQKSKKRTKKQMKEEEEEEGEPEEKPAKKARTKKADVVKAEDDDEVEPSRPSRKSRSKKAAAIKEEEQDDNEPIAKTKPVKKGRGRKAAALSAEEIEADELDEPKPSKRSRGKKGAAIKIEEDDEPRQPESKSTRKSRGKKAAAAVKVEAVADESQPVQKRNGRSAVAIKAEDDEQVEDLQPAKKGRASKASEKPIKKENADEGVAATQPAKKGRVKKGHVKQENDVDAASARPALNIGNSFVTATATTPDELAAVENSTPSKKPVDSGNEADKSDTGPFVKTEEAEEHQANDVPEKPIQKTKGRKAKAKKST